MVYTGVFYKLYVVDEESTELKVFLFWWDLVTMTWKVFCQEEKLTHIFHTT